jgi:hypothetical protein
MPASGVPGLSPLSIEAILRRTTSWSGRRGISSAAVCRSIEDIETSLFPKHFRQSYYQSRDSDQMDVVGHNAIGQNQQSGLNGVLENQAKVLLTVGV